ncbi:hypothetical protein INT45_000856 [Circinella minor]|uniref:Cytochrome b561 domain-containing protein n=1 Tax=Circinella minor TaxID=1195481 RepID=A0A8H7VHW2_9FUNG|nr:hypothetical protein INT45_000856 [Circinella minor]
MFKYKDAIFGLAIQSGLLLFLGLVIAVLVQIPFTYRILHPIFMMLFVVSITEGVYLLQTTSTPKEKKKGLKLHAFIQSFAYVFLLVGFIIMVHAFSTRSSHFNSQHSKFGLAVFIYIFFQGLFGITMAYFPNFVFGSIDKGKSLWKFHRITGYLFLILVWVTAELGIRTPLMITFMPTPNMIAGHWVALVLVVIGITGRVRLYKWGLGGPPKARHDSLDIIQDEQQQTSRSGDLEQK